MRSEDEWIAVRDELASKWWVQGDMHSGISFKEGFDSALKLAKEEIASAQARTDFNKKFNVELHDELEILRTQIAEMRECL